MAPFLRKKSGVAVVEIFGTIGTGAQVSGWSSLLRRARGDRHIKALLLDIDSPGGSVGGTEMLFTQLQRIAREKPVVAFVRGMGASGAYLLSCGARRIVCLPSSLVGSIGVLFVRPAIHDLLDRFGVGLSVYKGGRFKDMTGFWRGPTAEEDAKFEGLVQEVHESFIASVAHGRGMDPDRVREAATGEVFTGKRALEMGLVDEIGDFERAVEVAAEMGGTRPRPLWLRPKRGLFERMAGRFGRSVAAGVVTGLGQQMPTGLFYGDPTLMRDPRWE